MALWLCGSVVLISALCPEVLLEPTSPILDHACSPKADPSWFGYVITVRPVSGLERARIVAALEEAKIETRNLFCGNLLRHPAYEGIEHRIAEPLVNTDLITTNTFFIGVYPGLTDPMIDHMIETLDKALG